MGKARDRLVSKRRHTNSQRKATRASPTVHQLLRIEPGMCTLSNPEFRKRFEKELAYWEKKVAPLIKAARDSERLSAADFNIRINI